MSVQLQTCFGGLRLASPLIVGACPLTMNEQTRNAMQDAGAGAIVLPSLFEEQVVEWSIRTGRPVTELERSILARSERSKPNWACPDADSYLALVNRSSTLHTIPVIASMNGISAGGWMDFASELQEAGAAAIELNVHPGALGDFESAAEIEKTILDAIRDIHGAIAIPLFVKLGRNFTSIPHMARQLLSGASGLVLHGRTPATDICLDTMKLTNRWRLSRADDDFDSVGILLQVHRHCPAMPLAASGGIGQADHLIKALLAGADVATVTSAIYREGPAVIRVMLDGLTQFMDKHHLQTMTDLQMQRPLEFNDDEQRSAYIAALTARLDGAGAGPAGRALAVNAKP
jgi:dihydroorotate dehydrogenase (fumarate)